MHFVQFITLGPKKLPASLHQFLDVTKHFVTSKNWCCLAGNFYGPMFMVWWGWVLYHIRSYEGTSRYDNPAHSTSKLFIFPSSVDIKVIQGSVMMSRNYIWPFFSLLKLFTWKMCTTYSITFLKFLMHL